MATWRRRVSLAVLAAGAGAGLPIIAAYDGLAGDRALMLLGLALPCLLVVLVPPRWLVAPATIALALLLLAWNKAHQMPCDLHATVCELSGQTIIFAIVSYDVIFGSLAGWAILGVGYGVRQFRASL